MVSKDASSRGVLRLSCTGSNTSAVPSASCKLWWSVRLVHYGMKSDEQMTVRGFFVTPAAANDAHSAGYKALNVLQVLQHYYSLSSIATP